MIEIEISSAEYIVLVKNEEKASERSEGRSEDEGLEAQGLHTILPL